MAEPGGEGNGCRGPRRTKRTRYTAPDSYEVGLGAEGRESNLSEEELDTFPDTYAPAVAHGRELESFVTDPGGPSCARPPPMANSSNTPTRKSRRADDTINLPKVGYAGFKVMPYISRD